MTKKCSRAQIGIFDCLRKLVNGGKQSQIPHDGISISWSGGERHRVNTSSYDGGIKAAFYGFDTARLLKSILRELLFGNG